MNEELKNLHRREKQLRQAEKWEEVIRGCGVYWGAYARLCIKLIPFSRMLTRRAAN